ncbi:hypothetical protein [Nocardioides convexus]|uniref:hypothetical protein n=1 Tax=Nocardioides convexus TaxID=2712224 RepID=UPI0024181D35|nr:hypothetical protein [Nocardioides convexus]
MSRTPISARSSAGSASRRPRSSSRSPRRCGSPRSRLYIRAGILSPDDGVGGSVELAILGDTGLSERQKQSLLDVYASFLALNAADAAAESDASIPNEIPDSVQRVTNEG